MVDMKLFGNEIGELIRGLIASPQLAIERRNVAALRSLYGGFNRGDIDLAVSVVTEDYELTDLASGEVTRGREAFHRRLKTGKRAFPDASAEIRHLYIQGDIAVVEVVNRATHTGPFRVPGTETDIPATGRSLNATGCEVYEFFDGEIARGRIYFDLISFGQQLGLDI